MCPLMGYNNSVEASVQDEARSKTGMTDEEPASGNEGEMEGIANLSGMWNEICGWLKFSFSSRQVLAPRFHCKQEIK